MSKGLCEKLGVEIYATKLEAEKVASDTNAYIKQKYTTPSRNIFTSYDTPCVYCKGYHIKRIPVASTLPNDMTDENQTMVFNIAQLTKEHGKKLALLEVKKAFNSLNTMLIKESVEVARSYGATDVEIKQAITEKSEKPRKVRESELGKNHDSIYYALGELGKTSDEGWVKPIALKAKTGLEPSIFLQDLKMRGFVEHNGGMSRNSKWRVK